MDTSSPPHRRLHKRKLPSPSSSAAVSGTGTCTRSKSQMYLHSNRSGRARSDPVHRFYQINRDGSEGVMGFEGKGEMGIKDLRARRVFPTGPARSGSPENEGKVGFGSREIGEGEKIDNGLLRNLAARSQSPDNEGMIGFGGGGIEEGEKIDNGLLRNVVKGEKGLDFSRGENGGEKVRNEGNVVEKISGFGGGGEKRKEVVGNMRQNKVFIAPGSFNYRRLTPFVEDIKPVNCEMGIVDGKSQNNLSHGNHESHGQKHSDIILNEQSVTEHTGVGCKGSSQISNEEEIRGTESHKSGALSDTERENSGIVNDDADLVFADSLLNNEQINGDTEQLKGHNSSIKMVANMRPRKVFKPPGSFSYRRLLPYLEDTEKDQTTSLKIEMVNEKLQNNLNNRKLESCDQDASIMALNEQSVAGYCTDFPCKGSSESSHGEKTDNAGSHEFGVQVQVQPFAELDISGVVNNDADSVFGLMDNEILKNDMDDPARVDDLMEELLQSTPGKDVKFLVNNRVDTTFGDTILNNSDSKNDLNGLTGVNDSNEEYVESMSEEDLSRVVKNIADTVLGDRILDGSMKNDWDGMTRVSDLQEVDVQMTPPDAVIFTTTEIESNPQDIAGKTCPTESIPPCHTSNSVMDTNGPCDVNKSFVNSNQSTATPSKIRTVLNPCSRQRVFKPSSSFSYRRLLPYLTSVSGDQHPGLVKTSKEGSSMNHFIPVSSSKTQETGENRDNQTVPSPTPSVSSLNSDSGSNSSNHVPASVTSPSINNHVKILDMQSKEPLQTISIESNSVSKLNPEFSYDQGVSLHGVNQNNVLTDSQNKVSQNELDGNGHDSVLVDNEQLSEAIITKESPSKDLLLNPLSHGNGSQRGILKRNPRGCRGLCDCVHCASFRLHAERSFEFSRNQLQDTEEVASNLVKELSSLRHMLEQLTAKAPGQTVIHINKLQVMDACQKAVEAENLAKESLKEMNDDLNHHCRTKCLSRPRVAFLSKKPRNE